MPSIRAAEDLDIHYLTAGHGEPVVCVHGNWGSARWFTPLLERLPAGLQAHAIDLRGRGDTRGPDHDYSLPALARDLRAFLDAMGLASAHLVGHSLGAGVILQLALDAPQYVRSLLCLAPPWIEGMPHIDGLVDYQRRLHEDRAMLSGAVGMLFASPPDPDYFAALIDDASRQRLAATLGTVTALEDWRPGATLSTITAPRRVINGARDPLTTPEHATACAAALGCPLDLLPDIGHALIPEAPQQIADALAALTRG